MDWFTAMMFFMLGGLAVYAYFVYFPPPCKSCAASGQSANIWNQLRTQQPQNDQDEDVE